MNTTLFLYFVEYLTTIDSNYCSTLLPSSTISLFFLFMFFVVPSTAVRLPALKDGETVIFGANAICYYIGFKYDLKNTMNCSNDCEDASNLSSIIENLLDFEESKLSPTVETLKKSKFIFF